MKNIRTRLAYDPDDLDFVVFLGKLEDYFVKYLERSADRHASILSRGARREQQTVVGFNQPDYITSRLGGGFIQRGRVHKIQEGSISDEGDGSGG